jgi:Flp pilus assembly protein CpaB
LRRGDRVDVLATFDPPPAGQEPTFPVAEAALVVDVGPEAASVAVGPEEAKRVAFAVASGTVTLTVTPAVKPGSPAAPRTGGTTGSAPTTLPANR